LSTRALAGTLGQMGDLGTRVELSSPEMDAEGLLDVAERLVPASSAPPRFG
jgi:hypothetical protein